MINSLRLKFATNRFGVWALLLVAGLIFPQLVNAQSTDNIISGEIIVQMQYQQDVHQLVKDFNENVPGAQMEASQVLSRRLNIHLLEFDPTAVTDLDALRKVKFHEKVSIAQFNHTNVALRDTCTNDPDFPTQWAHYNDGSSGGDADMKSCDAWNIGTGGYTSTGDRIVVAVIDGGFQLDHEDLNFWENSAEIPNNNIDDDNNGYIDDVRGWNPSSNDDNVVNGGNFDSHGTHVSGIVGAIGDNGIGVVGVNHDVEIMAIEGSSGNEATVVAAYGYILEQRAIYNNTNGAEGAFVVSTNSSFGVDNADPNNFPLWCNFYDSLGVEGILSAGATANNNVNVDVSGDVPTACTSDYLITVTNTDRDDNRATAGYGALSIDLGAPGSGILSTVPTNDYSSQSGTSMATPQVAGAIALMWSVACEQMVNDYKANPGAMALFMKDQLLNWGTDQVADLQGETVTGGRLNLWKALTSLGYYPGCIPLGVEELETPFDFTVMPNPNDGHFSVAISTEAYGDFELEIRNVLGQVVQSEFVQANGSEQTLNFDLSGAEAGMYFVRMSDGQSKSKTVKVLVR